MTLRLTVGKSVLVIVSPSLDDSDALRCLADTDDEGAPDSDIISVAVAVADIDADGLPLIRRVIVDDVPSAEVDLVSRREVLGGGVIDIVVLLASVGVGVSVLPSGLGVDELDGDGDAVNGDRVATSVGLCEREPSTVDDGVCGLRVCDKLPVSDGGSLCESVPL